MIVTRFLYLFILLASLNFNHAFAAAGASAAEEKVLWAPVTTGSRIVVIMPSNGVGDEDAFRVAAESTKKVLEGYDLVADVDDTPHSGGYVIDRIADSTESVFDHIKHAIEDDSTAALWAMRGGRTSVRLLQPLAALIKDRISTGKRVPPVIGFSDVTSLLLLWASHGLPAIHAPVLQFSKDTGNGVNLLQPLSPVIDLLRSPRPSQSYKGLVPLTDVEAGATFEGRIMGGNLSNLQYWSNLISAKSADGSAIFSWEGRKIIPIETWDDDTRITSILAALHMGGFFKNSVIIFGALHGKRIEADGYAEAEAEQAKVISAFLSDAKLTAGYGGPSVPTVFGTTEDVAGSTLRFGHGDWNNPILMGVDGKITVTDPADPARNTFEFSL